MCSKKLPDCWLQVLFHEVKQGVWGYLTSGVDKDEYISGYCGVFAGSQSRARAILYYAGGGAVVSGFGLAFAAGVMTNVTIDELIPVAHEFCKPVYKHMCLGVCS